MCRDGMVMKRGDKDVRSDSRSRNGQSFGCWGSMSANLDDFLSVDDDDFWSPEYGSVGERDPICGDNVPLIGERAFESFGVPAPEDSIKIVWAASSESKSSTLEDELLLIGMFLGGEWGVGGKSYLFLMPVNVLAASCVGEKFSVRCWGGARPGNVNAASISENVFCTRSCSTLYRAYCRRVFNSLAYCNKQR